jgi:hypothetical protein
VLASLELLSVAAVGAGVALVSRVLIGVGGGDEGILETLIGLASHNTRMKLTAPWAAPAKVE